MSRFYYEFYQTTHNNSPTSSSNQETASKEDQLATMGVLMRNNHNKTRASLDHPTSSKKTTTSETSSSKCRTTTTVESSTMGSASIIVQKQGLPPLPWPQAPLMLRASPQTTRVVGVRRAYSTNDNPNNSLLPTKNCCLPINTGDEENPWAIDFESDLFRGTMMVRVKGATAADSSPSASPTTTVQKNYFIGKQRKFQVLITGQFLRSDIRKSAILSGQILEQPIGKLPGLPIVSAVLKVYKTLQPKSHVELGNAQAPYAQALSPLVALAQTVLVQDGHNHNHLPTEEDLQEPHPSDPNSLYPDGSLSDKAFSVDQRRKRRKKLVGDNEKNHHDDCFFDMNKTYSFDMYQHQLNLTDYTLQLAMYRLPIAPVLNGQPLRILATVGDERAWSFELWHESLLLH